MLRMRVLHMYNVLGAVSERPWLEVAQLGATEGWQAVLAYETRAGECPEVGLPTVQVGRVAATAVLADVEAELERLAVGPRCVEGVFDVIHGHLGTRLLLAWPFLAGGPKRVPLVLSLYGYDCSRLLRDECWGRRYKLAAQRGAVFVVLCEAMKRRLMMEGIDETAIRVIRLGIDPRLWEMRQEQPAGRCKFVFVGRLVEKKGVDVLIEAVEELTRTGEHVWVEIVGDGPLRSDLERMVVSKGLTESVTFAGGVAREAVRDKLRGATAFVLPSKLANDGDSEGTPIVLMEAQAMGVPCVTTDHVGNAEVICPQGRELVATEGSARSLADAMRRFLKLDDRARADLARAGRAWIEQRYDIRKTAEEYRRLYIKLAAE